MEYRNTKTGEIAPAHRIGTNDEGEVLYQFVEGWEPTAPYTTDEDGNWIERVSSAVFEARYDRWYDDVEVEGQKVRVFYEPVTEDREMAFISANMEGGGERVTRFSALAVELACERNGWPLCGWAKTIAQTKEV